MSPILRTPFDDQDDNKTDQEVAEQFIPERENLPTFEDD